MTAAHTTRTGFTIMLVVAVILGTFLRFTLLQEQILLDDEWHSLNQVIDASFTEVLMGFDAKDNTSLPLNIYDWLLLHSFGWSEIGIRLPVLLGGLLGLVLLPLAFRKIAGDRAALIFAFLLAIAPFAVFYSRFSRAYVVIMLLCYLALIFAHRWLTTGEGRAATGMVILGTLAVYSHPLSVIVVAVPFVVLSSVTMLRKSAPGGRAVAVAVVPAGGIKKIASIQGALLIPLGWLMWSAGPGLPWGEGSWSGAGTSDAMTLLSGTTSVPWNISFYGLLLVGLISMFRKYLLLALFCLVTVILYVVALMISRPFGLETGVVVVRYMIVVLPLALSAIAVGVDTLLNLPGKQKGLFGLASHPVVGVCIVGFLVVGLAVAGPLPALYAAPNNFTNHSAYQGSYAPPDPHRSDARHVYPGFSLSINDVPEFYRSLRVRSDIDAIVEYPFDVTNYNNLFYYYQRVHGKKVIAGYSTDRELVGHRAEIPPGDEQIPLRLGRLTADQILSHVADPAALKFRNMVDVTDPVALERSDAGVLIIHKYVMALRFLPGGHDAVRVWYRSSVHVADRYRRIFGLPIYEDGELICFRIEKL